MRKLLESPGAALFALAFVAYAYFYQAGGWNQNVRFDLIRSLVETRSTIIDGYHVNTGDLSCHGDQGRCKGRARADLGEHYYCDKAPGASLLGVPPYVATYLVAGSEQPSPRYLAVAVYLSTLASVALPSALSVAALFMLLAAIGLSRRASAGLALAYAFATLSFPYSTLLYGHQTAAALLLMAFALLVRARARDTAPPLFLVGLLLGYSVVCEYPAALAVLPITIYAALSVRPWKRLIPLVVGGALCAALLAAYHWIAFGGPLTLPYEFSTQHFRSLGIFMGLGKPNWPAFSNTMFTSYRGLFFSAPWLLLALPGAAFLLRRKRHRPEAIVAVVVFLLFVWMTSSLIDSWHGGWSLGARYMIPAIPFLVFLVAGLFLPARKEGPRPALLRRGVAVATTAFACYSAFLMLAGTAVRPEVPQHIKKPFAQYALPNFYAGKVSVNPQGIHQIAPPRGNPPPQAWNLGMLIGLKGHASLIPLYLLIALGGAWLVLLLRRDATSSSGDGSRSEADRGPPEPSPSGASSNRRRRATP